MLNAAGRLQFGYVQQRVKIMSMLEYGNGMAEMMSRYQFV